MQLGVGTGGFGGGLLVPMGTGLCMVLALALVQVRTSWLQTQLLWLLTSTVALKPALLLYEAL